MYISCALTHIGTNDVAIFDSYAHSLIHSLLSLFFTFFRTESGECERDVMEVAAKIKRKSERGREREENATK